MFDKYTETFCNYLGGEFLWGAFKKSFLSGYFTFAFFAGVTAVFLGLYSAQIKVFLFLLIFLVLVIAALGALFIPLVREFVLKEDVDFSKAKLGLYFLVYTGLFCTGIVSLSLF